MTGDVPRKETPQVLYIFGFHIIRLLGFLSFLPDFFSEHSAWVLLFFFFFFFPFFAANYVRVCCFIFGEVPTSDWIVTNGCLSSMGLLIRLCQDLRFFISPVNSVFTLF